MKKESSEKRYERYKSNKQDKIGYFSKPYFARFKIAVQN